MKWYPLESNPEVMNTFASKLGFDESKFVFTDVFSTDDWALEMVPKPVLAVLLLFPIKTESEAFRRQRNEKASKVVSDKVYFMKQTVDNACGTIGILHAIGNAVMEEKKGIEGVAIKEGSYLSNFLEKTRYMAPEDIAAVLEGDVEIDAMHEAATSQGQSTRPDRDDDVNTHFICFVEKDGQVYELDGRKACPINHGPSSGSLLDDSCRIIRTNFMDADPGELRFTILALARADAS